MFRILESSRTLGSGSCDAPGTAGSRGSFRPGGFAKLYAIVDNPTMKIDHLARRLIKLCADRFRK